MRLATIFLIASMLQVSAATMAQQVTLKKSDVTLRQLFKEVRKQTGYSVIWGSEEFNANEKMAVDFNRSSLQEVFDKIVAGKGYSYLIDEKTIIIESKKDKINVKPVIMATIDVTGKVVDEQGRPLVGATVTVKLSGRAVSTNSDGKFLYANVEEGTPLIVNYIGYERIELKAIKDMGTIVLKVADNKLDEVQIRAYGVTSRRLTTSNISTVKAEEIGKTPVTNPILALQGRVTGVQITQQTGVPGGGVTIQIQGRNSMLSGQDPFYVIDGVPFTSRTFSTLTGSLGPASTTAFGGSNGAGSALSFINPEDIESIDILKDASATAIYGSRAANGAILITTKKGKAGKLKLDAQIQRGWQSINKRLPMLNREQYLEMRYEFKRLSNTPISATDFDLNGIWSSNPEYDWQEAVFGQSPYTTAVQVAASGGSQNTQFRVGIGYNRQDLLLPEDLGNNFPQKGNVQPSVNFNLTTKSNDQKFSMSFTGNYVLAVNKLNNTTPLDYIYTNPFAPNPLNPDGSINWDLDAFGETRWLQGPATTHPFALFQNNNKLETNNLTASLNLSYNIVDGLSIGTILGYNRFQQNQITTGNAMSQWPSRRATFVRNSSFLYGKSNNWNINPTINYKKNIGYHELEMLVGASFQKSHSDNQSFSASGFTSDQVLENILAAPTITALGADDRDYSYLGILGRLSYRYNGKYLFDLSANRDGSSRFGPENQFHAFWSAGAGWIISEENFIKKNMKYLSFAKIKVSYGTTGNDQVGDYTYLDLFPYTANPGVLYRGVPGASPSRLYTPFLQWEESRKLNFGLDLGFLNDRVILSANYGITRSDNQLNNYFLPTGTGFSSITLNIPALVQNVSTEFSASVKVIKRKDFTWTSSANMTIPKNKLLRFDKNRILTTLGFIEGKPLGIQYFWEYKGVDPATGLSTVADANGNPTTAPNTTTDKTKLVDMNQRWYGGIDNLLTYKNFSFSFLFQYVNTPTTRFTSTRSSLAPGSQMVNVTTDRLQRWQQPGDIIAFPKYAVGTAVVYPFNSSTDAGVVDGSYMRLKNASFSWNLPEKYTRKLHVNGFRVFAQGTNLITFTSFKGPDPEGGGTSTYPPLRVFTLGAQITL